MLREVATPTTHGTAPPRQAKLTFLQLLIPSLSDWVFVSVLAWLFFAAAGAASLLSDGDTGWHIRTGEYILSNGQFPQTDPFSFTMEGRRWFAWEWLADVLFGVVHDTMGLKGISLLGGVVVAATAAALLRYMIWLRVNVLVAIVGMLLVCSASVIHWLSRPHMFTWGFLLATLWLLEADRRRPSRQVYLLVPLVILWTNVHGGFVALLMSVGIYMVGVSIDQLRARWSATPGPKSWQPPPALRRYGLLLLLCLAGTVVNPYTYHLHEHIFFYLQSDFILEHVREFQSPDFRGESMRVYEGVLILSIAFVARLLWRHEVALALVILAWAHASLVSVRHVPLFMIAAVPLLARELTLLLEEGARSGNGWLRGLKELADDYGGQGNAVSESRPAALSWLGMVAVIGLAMLLHVRSAEPDWKAEFPDIKFPVLACDTLDERLLQRRVLTTDQWGDYLIYRFYPQVKVFIDGRSDFYDPAIRDEYVALLGSHWNWTETLERHKFEALLIPVDWTLAAALKIDPDWHLLYDDGQTLFFERKP